MVLLVSAPFPCTLRYVPHCTGAKQQADAIAHVPLQVPCPGQLAGAVHVVHPAAHAPFLAPQASAREHVAGRHRPGVGPHFRNVCRGTAVVGGQYQLHDIGAQVRITNDTVKAMPYWGTGNSGSGLLN